MWFVRSEGKNDSIATFRQLNERFFLWMHPLYLSLWSRAQVMFTNAVRYVRNSYTHKVWTVHAIRKSVSFIEKGRAISTANICLFCIQHRNADQSWKLLVYWCPESCHSIQYSSFQDIITFNRSNNKELSLL